MPNVTTPQILNMLLTFMPVLDVSWFPLMKQDYIFQKATHLAIHSKNIQLFANDNFENLTFEIPFEVDRLGDFSPNKN